MAMKQFKTYRIVCNDNLDVESPTYSDEFRDTEGFLAAMRQEIKVINKDFELPFIVWAVGALSATGANLEEFAPFIISVHGGMQVTTYSFEQL